MASCGIEMESYRADLAAFQGARVPRDPMKMSEDVANILTGIKFFGALSEKLRELTFKMGRKRPYETLNFDEKWEDGIFDWMIYLFDYYYPASDDSFPSRWDAISYIACIFEYYLEDPERQEYILSSPRDVELAVRLWLNTDYDYERHPNSFYYGWWGPFLTFFDTISDESICNIKIFEVDGVTKSILAKLVLKRVESNINPEDCISQQYLQLLSAMAKLELLYCVNDISSTRIIRAFMRAIRELMSYVRKLGKDSRPELLSATLRYIHYIGTFMSEGRSIDAMCEAINLDLVSLVVEFSPFFTVILDSGVIKGDFGRKFVDGVINIFSKNIPMCLMYDSVRTALKNAGVVKISDDRMRKTLAANEWMDFICRVEQSLELKQDDTAYIAFCDNPKHHINWNRNPKEQFKCSRCQSVWYCSEKCHHEHWNDTHRTECHKLSISKNLPPIRNRLRKRDHRSALHSGISELQFSWAGLKEVAQREARKPLTELSVNFDYSQHPSLMSVRPKDAFGSAAVTASRFSPDTVVVQCIIPLGDSSKGIITAVGRVNNTGKVAGNIWTTGKSYITYQDKASG